MKPDLVTLCLTKIWTVTKTNVWNIRSKGSELVNPWQISIEMKLQNSWGLIKDYMAQRWHGKIKQGGAREAEQEKERTRKERARQTRPWQTLGRQHVQEGRRAAVDWADGQVDQIQRERNPMQSLRAAALFIAALWAEISPITAVVSAPDRPVLSGTRAPIPPAG